MRMQLELCSVACEQENSIGQEFALYYLAYATYLELRGNFATAETVFQEGLSRSAPHYLSFPRMAVQVLLREPKDIFRPAGLHILLTGLEPNMMTSATEW